ncbi:asparaginase [Campylobacter sp. faydin G-105]|uniref:asparaginase n=1 Tax=Campylobacter anatolicus TaxID=2829105 RepID=UPI001B9D7278|nr:asparaginase [Campylobacter anatolicus]MBR8462118.1 asparaginase [Campylobacter anatolicus]
MSKPKISVGALGGTICMSANGGSGGVKPSFSAADLIGAVPVLANMAEFNARTILAIPSGSIKIKDLIEVYNWAKAQVAQGAIGVIITQGTDTLEESAFFLNLIWDEPNPLVITGAMRNPDNISSDGAGNIYASVLTVLNEQSRNRGVLVVLNDTVHSAKWAHKSDTFSLQTFVSVNGGIQGIIAENDIHYISAPVERTIYKVPKDKIAKVAIIESYLENEGEMIKFIQNSDFEGMVISGFGAGHVSYDMMDEIKKFTKPIVIASRTSSGRCAVKTYGYKGSEIELQECGCVMSGWLSSLKARLLLIVLLSSGASRDTIKQEFAKF